MRAAHALGRGTIARAAPARHSALIRRHFNLADDRRVVCGISFGYPDHAHKINSYRTSRASIAETVAFVEQKIACSVIARSACDEAIQSEPGGSGLLRGACHRARVRATRWLAMT